VHQVNHQANHQVCLQAPVLVQYQAVLQVYPLVHCLVQYRRADHLEAQVLLLRSARAHHHQMNHQVVHLKVQALLLVHHRQAIHLEPRALLLRATQARHHQVLLARHLLINHLQAQAHRLLAVPRNHQVVTLQYHPVWHLASVQAQHRV